MSYIYVCVFRLQSISICIFIHLFYAYVFEIAHNKINVDDPVMSCNKGNVRVFIVDMRKKINTLRSRNRFQIRKVAI